MNNTTSRQTEKGKLRHNSVDALKAVLIYATFASVWIVLSDKVVIWLFSDPSVIGTASTMKGWLFILVTSALLYLLLKERHPVQRGDSENGDQVTTAGTGYFSIAFIALLLLVPLIGVAFINLQAPKIEENAYRNLQAVAQLKSSQIQHWLAERHGDTKTLAASSGLTARIHEFVEGKSDHLAQPILYRFKSLVENYGYSDVLLFDAKGSLLLTQGERPDMLPAVRDRIALAILTKSIQRSDLFRDEAGRVLIDWIVPVIIKEAHSERAVAAILLRANAANFLYPLIQNPFSASQSAETLLIRREGDNAVYLNELRHRQGTALTLKVSLSSPNLPAAVALINAQPGIIQGPDYREIDVLAAYQPVAGTNWHIVAKIDQDVLTLVEN